MDVCFLLLATFLKASMAGESRGAENCHQLVVYEASTRIFPTFDQKTRSFKFADKNWVIQQRWDEIGVASVVWEPVSFPAESCAVVASL